MLMNLRHLMSTALAALLANPMPSISFLPDHQGRAVKSLRINTGKTYPHSSKRQQCRNARQLAAGQIKFLA